ncbi:hypothetical protein AGLY_002453 [Aphis glycines]|uniref:Uncharacterized protein n=1 Tax=Aphis glycines TaxID=307491 RepID=A0A6G0U2M6_APHGL|nr:hypothetical protein AGLY_002453 [Aphis glycines]
MGIGLVLNSISEKCESDEVLFSLFQFQQHMFQTDFDSKFSYPNNGFPQCTRSSYNSENKMNRAMANELKIKNLTPRYFLDVSNIAVFVSGRFIFFYILMVFLNTNCFFLFTSSQVQHSWWHSIGRTGQHHTRCPGDGIRCRWQGNGPRSRTRSMMTSPANNAATRVNSTATPAEHTLAVPTRNDDYGSTAVVETVRAWVPADGLYTVYRPKLATGWTV